MESHGLDVLKWLGINCIKVFRINIAPHSRDISDIKINIKHDLHIHSKIFKKKKKEGIIFKSDVEIHHRILRK